MDELVVPVEGLVVQMEVTEPVTPARKTHRPLSRLLLVLVLLALLTVGAGFVLARRAADDRQVAIAARQRVETQVADQRDRNAATDEQVLADRARVETYAAATAAPIATAQQLDEMVDVQLGRLQTLQATGKTSQDLSYNRAVRDENAALEPYRAAATQLFDQAEAMPRPSP